MPENAALRQTPDRLFSQWGPGRTSYRTGAGRPSRRQSRPSGLPTAKLLDAFRFGQVRSKIRLPVLRNQAFAISAFLQPLLFAQTHGLQLLDLRGEKIFIFSADELC
ncbi:hypothetical protein B4135_4171 [Caldibacillus debilis]|uniref:Uncharacterized protein n=1 Tax=Caldibacillus debilis TaxID=301148 RepID=A0A150L6W5_9BACI|nr:hypothetical protein B4135_4171 [Caldibacillus debilis]